MLNKAVDVINGVLLEGESLSVKIRGKSMEPVINDGEIVEVIKKRVEKGDVVVLMNRGYLTCHTVLNVRNGKIYIQGENSGVVEGPFGSGDVVGVVPSKRPGYSGTLRKWVKRNRRLLLKVWSRLRG